MAEQMMADGNSDYGERISVSIDRRLIGERCHMSEYTLQELGDLRNLKFSVAKPERARRRANLMRKSNE